MTIFNSFVFMIIRRTALVLEEKFFLKLACHSKAGKVYYLELKQNKIICGSHYERGLSAVEITVGHRTLSDQILKMSGQFHIMIGHDDRTSHQHILSSLLQGVVSQ